MKIKRYFAENMRTAIRLVREEQGADAVILSSRPVDGGVEVVAAVDYDAELITDMANDVPEEVATEKRTQRSPVPSASASRTSKYDQDVNFPKADFAQRQLKKERPKLQPIPQGADGVFQPTASRLAESQKSDSGVDHFNIPASFPGATKANDILASTSARQAKRKLASEPSGLQVEWSQDPALQQMREEIQSLRKIMLTQLNGFAWGETSRTHPLYIQLMQYLLQLGLSPELCRELSSEVDLTDNMGTNWRQAMTALSSRIEVSQDDILTQGGVVALLGPTGVGKTTTAAKLAARYTLRHGANRVALVTTDCYRIGAYQQLRTYGRILGISVHVANSGEELRQTLDLLNDKELVLIDTAGVSLKDERLTEQNEMLQNSGHAIRRYVVLSTTTQRSTLQEVVQSYRPYGLHGAIMTKLDETKALGEGLDVAISSQLPIAYICDGQNVPEDIHPARANNLINRSVESMQQPSDEPDEEYLAMTFGKLSQSTEGARVYG